jgi:hypothetical protein
MATWWQQGHMHPAREQKVKADEDALVQATNPLTLSRDSRALADAGLFGCSGWTDP